MVYGQFIFLCQIFILNGYLDKGCKMSFLDELRKDKTSTEKNNVIFDVKAVEHWGGSVHIGFADWRK